MPPRKRAKIVPVEQIERNPAKDSEAQSSGRQTGRPEKDARAFRCQFCAKAFYRKEHLQRHERLRESKHIV
ncbi:hypothetical protein VI817_008711 [Penicillium citrinum]|nr:hypothetical protein VI817_008711 [Penicillium citrinum]